MYIYKIYLDIDIRYMYIHPTNIPNAQWNPSYRTAKRHLKIPFYLLVTRFLLNRNNKKIEEAKKDWI
jgi:hypothetical protein